MAHRSLFRIIALLITIPIAAGGIAISLPSFSVDSALAANETIRIYPATPTFYEPFYITVSGRWANSCAPAFHKLTTSGGAIRLEARTPDGSVPCQDEPTDWGLSVLVQPQQAFLHTAQLSIVSGITGQPISTAFQDFTISGGILPVPVLPEAGKPLALRVADFSPDGCIPRYVSHQVSGATVTVESEIPDTVCGQAPTPWQMDVSLEPMAAGHYQTDLYVTDFRQSPPTRKRVLQSAFTVAATIHYAHLPLWGCFGSEAALGGCAILPETDSQ